MSKGRLEAFSDGVIAIIITIMVLELRPPEEATLAALRPLAPILLTYLLSFVNVAIYWNNHHHLFQAVKHVSGQVLWANLTLLFFLSLFPFTTAWMDGQHFAPIPVAAYGLVLLGAALAYTLLTKTLLVIPENQATLAKAAQNNLKERLSLAMYGAAVLLAFINSWVSVGLYVLVAAMWFVPDRRFERRG